MLPVQSRNFTRTETVPTLQRSVNFITFKLSNFTDLNPLSPKINMHFLHTVLHTFPMVLLERICSNITTFHL